MVPPSIPHELKSRLHGYSCRRDDIGESGASVYRLDAPDRPPLIAKLFERSASDAASREAARLDWLRQAGIPAPPVLSLASTSTHDWLLMACLPGVNAAVATDAPAAKVRLVAEALVRLHALPVETCPFDETLATKLARAQANVLAGVVDEGNFDEDHVGLIAQQVFERLQVLHPGLEDLVVTHGDASLPNFMVADGRFAGFVDCGELGRSDRYQDLAICAHSVRHNLGSEWVDPLFRAYGLATVDDKRLYYYRLLDEIS